jgi:acyl carrier protein
MSNTQERLQTIFRDIFEDPDLVIKDETTALDVEGWDSLAHINLIIAVERKFGIRFATSEISSLKDAGQNVGSFIRLIEAKQGNR